MIIFSSTTSTFASLEASEAFVQQLGSKRSSAYFSGKVMPNDGQWSVSATKVNERSGECAHFRPSEIVKWLVTDERA